MQEAGQRFVPWLYKKVQEDSIPGVIWVNKPDLLCQIPWQRGSRKSLTGGSITNLLEAWAGYCGRSEEPDLRTCMKEVNYAVQHLEGWLRTVKVDEVEGYRLLQFDRRALRDVIQGRDTEDTENDSKADEEIDKSLEEHSSKSSFQTLPCEEDEHPRMKTTSQPLPLLSTTPSKKISRQKNSRVVERECLNENELRNSSSNSLVDRHGLDLSDRHPLSLDDRTSDPIGMEVIVFYFNREVARHYIKDEVGCRLYYNQHPQLKYRCYRDPFVQIALPHPDAGFDTPSVKRLLQSMQLGILIEMRNNDIFAKQLGLCSVYCNDTRYETHSEGKIRRFDGTKVYDFQLFCSHFESHCNGQGGCPSTEIFMTFGQTWNCDRSTEENLLSVAVIHCLARSQVRRLSPHRPTAAIVEDVELEIDDMTEDDNQIELLLGMQLPKQWQ